MPSPRGGGGNFPPRAHLPPRLGGFASGQQSHDYDRHPNKQQLQQLPPNASNGGGGGGDEPSPMSVVNTLEDARSPDISRNLNVIEERVPSQDQEFTPPQEVMLQQGPPPTPTANNALPMPGPYGMPPPGMPMPPHMHHGAPYPPPHHHPHHPPHPHGHPGMPPHPHMPPFHMSPPGAMMPHMGQFGGEAWPCDYCGIKFPNWEACSAHEHSCAAGAYHHQQQLSMRGPPPNGTMSLPGRAPRNRAHRGRKMALASFPNQGHLLIDENAEYAPNTDRTTYLLSTPADGESLSDRQCYVRSHFVELFISTASDVSSRHSRGAQKLHLNQIGLRCAYCVKLKARDRAERAICYPSSISRIYQTVADMQRFHFESCVAIPPKVLHMYKSLKTTRPRGVGSPQSYWDRSAREIGLIDTEEGIQVNVMSGGQSRLEMQKKSTVTGQLEWLGESGHQGQEQEQGSNLEAPVLEGNIEGVRGGQVQVNEGRGELGTPDLQAPEEHVPTSTTPVVSSPGSDSASKEEDHHNKQAPSATNKKEGANEDDANILLMLKQTPESPDTGSGNGVVEEEQIATSVAEV